MAAPLWLPLYCIVHIQHTSGAFYSSFYTCKVLSCIGWGKNKYLSYLILHVHAVCIACEPLVLNCTVWVPLCSKTKEWHCLFFGGENIRACLLYETKYIRMYWHQGRFLLLCPALVHKSTAQLTSMYVPTAQLPLYAASNSITACFNVESIAQLPLYAASNSITACPNVLANGTAATMLHQ